MSNDDEDRPGLLRCGHPPNPSTPRRCAAARRLRAYDIRIARDGSWNYRVTPISRKPLVKLFSTVLNRDKEGRFWLETPQERGQIDVEDAPFIAVEIRATGHGISQILRFRTNLDHEIEAGASHPMRVVTDPAGGGPRPYVLVRDRLDALIVRSVYYELVELAVEGEGERAGAYAVWSGGVFFPLEPAEA
ncbi:MAG: DUF1285 domain-containing protein [Alphaproteobacteria bacterium]